MSNKDIAQVPEGACFNMRALITGIRGFVAGHLAEHLLACGDQVVGSSRDARELPQGLRVSIPTIAWPLGAGPAGAEVVGYLRDFRPDVIYHLSAISAPGKCGGKGEPTAEALAANVLSTQEISDVIQQLGLATRLVLISSSHVYSPVTSAQPYCREDSPMVPETAYGRTKLLAEDYLRKEVAAARLDGVIVRAFHHTGPGQIPPGLCPEWVEQLLDPRVDIVQVFSMHAHLNVTDVRDVVRAYRILAEQGKAAEAYNVGSGSGVSTREIWETLKAVSGVDKPYRELKPESASQNPLPDIQKIVSTTNWRPQIPLAQTLKDMFEEARERLVR